MTGASLQLSLREELKRWAVIAVDDPDAWAAVDRRLDAIESAAVAGERKRLRDAAGDRFDIEFDRHKPTQYVTPDDAVGQCCQVDGTDWPCDASVLLDLLTGAQSD